MPILTLLGPAKLNAAPLFQIGLHDIYQFLGSSGLRRILGAIRVQHMEPDMALDEFGHQAIQSSSASGHQLKYIGALMLSSQSTFKGLHLSANTANADQEFFFVSSGVCHEILLILSFSIVFKCWEHKGLRS
jgi:hypothetical protein